MQKKKQKTKKSIPAKKITKKPKKIKSVIKKESLPVISEKTVDIKISQSIIDEMSQEFGGDKELILFFFAYLKFGRNGTKTYKYLHPDCTDDSCRVLGARMVAKLAKVNISAFLDSYDLGLDSYFEKIRQGMNAVNVDVVKVLVEKKGKNGKKKKEWEYREVKQDNWDVQMEMHNKLGKILGLEGKDNAGPSVAVQVNNLISDKKDTYGI